MIKYVPFVCALILTTAISLWITRLDNNDSVTGSYSEQDYYLRKYGKVPKAKQKPSDWFYRQRAYPYDAIPDGKPLEAILNAKQMRAAKSLDEGKSITWEPAGPTNFPGRITDLAVHPSDLNIIYAASAAGGILKSTDLGQTWNAIFDDYGALSMGAIAIHPEDPNILYAGTGEANAMGICFEGTGIYKSTDAGQTWVYKGLPNSLHIGRIVIDPLYPETLFVAVPGRYFGGADPDRGVYRSIDGGDNWEQILYIDETTGCIDIAYHPSTGTLFAAMWDKINIFGQQHRYYGPNSCIYRSSNNGETWERLGESHGLPSIFEYMSRIGVTVDPESNTVYACFTGMDAGLYGVYKSTDLGDNWIRVNTDNIDDAHCYWTMGSWFGQIRVVPGNPDVCFLHGIELFRTATGGDGWNQVGDNTHVDHHAMYIVPDNPNIIYDGCDGGVNYSDDMGITFTTFGDMANTQFYTVEIDHLKPYRLYGGTQDNGSLGTQTGNLDDWDYVLGGDGFYMIVDPTNSDIVYAEIYYGYLWKVNLSEGTGVVALNGINYSGDRHNWNTPVVMDPNNNLILYYGSNRLYKTYNGAQSWTPISGDLTGGPKPAYSSSYGTITTIAPAKTNDQVVYVGTDDGYVWVTQDEGDNWTQINNGLPDRYITRVAVDPWNAAIAYVTISGYRLSENLPHIFKTTDYGQNWTDIHGNLPDVPINDIIPDPFNPDVLYIGTDVGVFITVNAGTSWEPLGTGIPITPVLDIDFHPPTQLLVASTHGRSMYKTKVDCSDPDDGDTDGVGDACDNCLTDVNPGQEDADLDFIGDACDECTDTDGDGYGNPGYANNTCPDDNCPNDPNALQEDTDFDGVGDVCDNCPDKPNPDQNDVNDNGIGDVCDYVCGDTDGNRIVDILDIIFMIDNKFKEGPLPDPIESADVNSDGIFDLLDIIYMIDNKFKDGPEPFCP